MVTAPPSWDLHRTFLAVVREGSLSAAARQLGLTQPTAGRHVAALERALGLALFTRAPNGLVPTAAAEALVPHAEAMALAAETFGRVANGAAEPGRGTVRLTASEFVGAEILPPLLAAFRRDHPGIVIELVLTNRTEDLLRREADIAVRMVRPTQAALVAKRIGRVEIGLFAHRDYLAAAGVPRTLADLAHHTVIGFDRSDQGMRGGGPEGIVVTRESFSFRTDSDAARSAALRAGVGIGAMQVEIAERDPALVRVLQGAMRFQLDMWLAMHEGLRADPRVRALFDHLATGLAAYVGRPPQAPPTARHIGSSGGPSGAGRKTPRDRKP